MAKNLLTTPKGVAVWPHLHAPDEEFDSNGLYHTKLRLSGLAGEKFREQIDALMAQSLKQAERDNPKKKIKQADPPYTIDEDTGDLIIKTKTKASGTRRDGTSWRQRPALYDAFNRPIPEGTRVGGGSILRVSVEPFVWYTAQLGAGVTLRLKAVQVVEMKEFGQASADFFGFDVEEDGYAAPEQSEVIATDATEFDGTASESVSADSSEFDF